MVAAIAAEYQVSIEVARADTLSFLQELFSLGALQRESKT